MGQIQSKASALLRGQLNAFSIERLVRFLVALGCSIEPKVEGGEDSRSAKLCMRRRPRVAVIA